MNEQQILEILRQHGPMTARQVCIMCNETEDNGLHRARRLLRSMHKFRMVSQIGSIRECSYHPSVLWEAVE